MGARLTLCKHRCQLDFWMHGAGMKASGFAQTVALIAFALGAVIASNSKGGLFYVGAGLALGAPAWYLLRGQHLRGWVGPSAGNIETQLDAMEKSLALMEAEPDCEEGRSKCLELRRRIGFARHQLAERRKALD